VKAPNLKGGFIDNIVAMLSSFFLPALPAWDLNKDPTVWLDGTKAKHIFNNISILLVRAIGLQS